MAAPTPFDRQTSFALFSAENPLVPHTGVSLDAEFNAVKLASDETQQSLAKIQDADGVLKRGSVGRAQLDSSISIGFAAPSQWMASTAYDAEVSTVFYQSKFYICVTTHVSGLTFDASNWEEIADFTVAAVIADGSITSAKLADGAVAASKIADGSISNSKLASGAVSASKMADAAVTTTKYADASITPVKIADPVLMLSALMPAGIGPLPWSGKVLPAGWDWADGGVLLPDTVFPVLRAMYISDGFPFGQDGSGNPKKPDSRGRVEVGKDDMGGVAANRVTTAGSSVDGLTLGAVGGAQSVTLVSGQQASMAVGSVSVSGSVSGNVGNFQIAGSATNFLFVNGSVGGTVGFSGTGGNVVGNGTQATASGTLSGSMTGTGTAAGGNGAHTNMMPSIVCNKIIKAH